MKLTYKRKAWRLAFTLVEMIGVLAVISILASMLIPKIMQAINNTRINSTVESIQTAKTAVTDYYGKYTRIGGPGGVDLPSTGTNNFSAVLLLEKLIEKNFSASIGGSTNGPGGTRIEVVPGLVATTAPDATNAAYNLDDNGTSPNLTNDASGHFVVRVVIVGVGPEDLKDLNDRIDGINNPFPAATLNAEDAVGRVKYPACPAGSTANAFIYLINTR
jgi:prepilin-type N-terminal cleavage/methylation domain-containing protein